MNKDWVLFFRPHDTEMHASFRDEFVRQLDESGEEGTHIPHFQTYGFQVLYGIIDPEVVVRDETAWAKVEFIVPPFYSFPITIYWRAPGVADPSTLPYQDVSGMDIDIGWTSDFPDMEYLQPYLATAKEDFSDL